MLESIQEQSLITTGCGDSLAEIANQSFLYGSFGNLERLSEVGFKLRIFADVFVFCIRHLGDRLTVAFNHFDDIVKTDDTHIIRQVGSDTE